MSQMDEQAKKGYSLLKNEELLQNEVKRIELIPLYVSEGSSSTELKDL